MTDMSPLLNRLSALEEANHHRRMSGYREPVMMKRNALDEVRAQIREAHLRDAVEGVRDQIRDRLGANAAAVSKDEQSILATLESALLAYERSE